MEKKRVTITLSFKCDHLFNQVSQNIKCALKRTYFFAELNVLHNPKGLNLNRQLTKVFELNAAYIIY